MSNSNKINDESFQEKPKNSGIFQRDLSKISWKDWTQAEKDDWVEIREYAEMALWAM